jgi:hypothetical protein
MTAPIISSARTRLFEQRNAARDLDDRLADLQTRVASSRAQIGTSTGLESELRALDAHEGELFTAAARSDDPETALAAMKVDQTKRANILRRIATANARRSGIESAIADLVAEERKLSAQRNAAREALKVSEAMILVAELVPQMVEKVTESHIESAAAATVLDSIYSAVVSTAHSLVEGPARAEMFAQIEPLGATIKSARAPAVVDATRKRAGELADAFNQSIVEGETRAIVAPVVRDAVKAAGTEVFGAYDVKIGVRLDNAAAAIERIANHGEDVLTRISKTFDSLERRDAEQTAKLEALAKRIAENERITRRGLAENERNPASWSTKR